MTGDTSLFHCHPPSSQDAASRGRLGASTFRRLNLGLALMTGIISIVVFGGSITGTVWAGSSGTAVESATAVCANGAASAFFLLQYLTNEKYLTHEKK